ncbi:hypothetical protein GGI04_000301 [Coemansia thaxteri]|uniref:Glycosyltransferase family 25 protein n=1 Tax=Coemansia thaxteri TaxID=2663907 RepID=A0A9W8BHF8_9FUNG|nr:hypothetical protein H4R26_000521 [Coemansia thaxteri]KAJ2009578.1 hypothetical protein GGI04_000301 [Coemansia thaxteri]KAJ2472443.1 hypothetical protein GGI02_001574 [Coemansia sp. RSA 2322]KAJ2487470.1 hypothetical protein EV174_000522 [Coemansia sp. RSA 2320]
MISAADPGLISSYELVARSLEDSIKYDNLSDAEKSRARKRNHVRRVDRRSFGHRCLARIRNVDLFWALTTVSIGGFVLIALTLLYFRHGHQLLMHRFSHEELSRRQRTLGFDRIYVIERPMHENTKVHRARWEGEGEKLGIDFVTWPVSAPNPLDPHTIMLHQRECWRPHLAIYRDIVTKGYMDALIVEDHVVFGPSPRLRIYSALVGVPADWDVLQLGPAGNGTDSGHHDDIPIKNTLLKYRRVDDGACNNLAYAISHAGTRKILSIIDSTHAHADFEHKLLGALDRVKLLLFRVSPSIFLWQNAGAEI